MKNGALIPNGSITFTWSRNGTVLGNVSGLGKSVAYIDSPALYGTDTIGVRATASDETISANTSVVVPNAKPVLALYEDHPLYGITYFQTLPGQISGANDMTVAAEPYFAAIDGLGDPNISYNWLLNGSAYSASSTKRNEVTIDSTQKSAALHLDISSPINFFLSVASDWKFTFGNSGGSPITKPGTTDIFHNNQQ
jgi:hypothetical protein